MSSGTSSGRVTSIARGIAVQQWVRRLGAFILFDVLLFAVLIGSFVWACRAQMSPEAVAWTTLSGDPIASLFELITNHQTSSSGLVLEVTDTSGDITSHPLSQTFAIARPVAWFVLIAQGISLIWGLFDTRRIRRRLKPLNELALTADALGHATANGMDKIESLEAAISSASVDSPDVSTGDQDLRSIEIALNGLLRRMQEAKLQQMRFVSDASHELRTPIAVLQGYVNMLDRWGKTDEAVLDESIVALKQETAHMQELVEQLLFLARGDSGRTTLERSVFNLVDVVREVCEESAMIDSAHTYELGASIRSDENLALYMSGDIAMVKQSMRIMVQNAAKYSQDGSVITLDAKRTDAGVAYSVQDEGIGMNAEEAAHAFERFWRSDTARSGSDGGTGLGLSIAKWIVDAHEGTIEVRSHPEVGTRFTVNFPKEEVYLPPNP